MNASVREVLDELMTSYQNMRREGETDMRSVIMLLDCAIDEIEMLGAVSDEYK
ncbi:MULTISPECIES: hypothetical protein [unclassified Exiguobacterium]|uniref:hypothetical protein n=1 Tax=unclassified Exiguobacterium TaxID=2644629 RepID=UPI001BE65D2C|nr:MULTISPECIES: hypothetical protein [unclassified Exiguobacterium]